MDVINRFVSGESGAVTVDWVVLTAATIGLGAAVMSSVGTGGMTLADLTASTLSGSEVASYIPVPTYGAAISGMGYGVAGACSAQMVNGLMVQNCGPGYTVFSTTYSMSNGEVWSKTVRTVDGQDPQISWVNADGELVDAPEAT
jgi:hypothetical protein